jgi:hypothetical protein
MKLSLAEQVILAFLRENPKGLSRADLAARMGKDRRWVGDRVRWLLAKELVDEYVDDDGPTMLTLGTGQRTVEPRRQALEDAIAERHLAATSCLSRVRGRLG